MTDTKHTGRAAPLYLATVRVDIIERMPNSTNGNPRYRVWFTTSDGIKLVAHTRPNAQFAYVMPEPGDMALACYRYARDSIVLDDLQVQR
ncbi:MAG: hypothetical protein MUE62_06370 [Burkholderiaceae bacterium]|jgi:hypothetical protein|nr:hypothetical protein [Burkholderiaceae bacterium]